MTEPKAEPVPLRVIAAQWTRLGCIGFGGPPAHIALLRKLVIDDRGWLDPREFEDGVAAVTRSGTGSAFGSVMAAGS